METNHVPASPAAVNIRAVIFDLGGVILRTDDPAPRLALAERVGKTRAELEEIVFGNPVSPLAEEGRATQEAVWEYVRQELRLAPEEVAPFRQAFFGGDQVDFELVALIRSLRPAYRTALLSNGWMTDLPRFLHQDLRIPEDTFDFIISSASHGLAKPKPAIFHLALEMTGAEPAQAIFVDDNEKNIRAARELGLHAIHFRDPQQAQAELRALIALSEGSR